MKAELITGLDALGSAEDEWRRLAVEQGNAFLTAEWLRAWCSGAAGDRLPLIALVRRDDGSLAGVMPMVLDRPGRRGTLRFPGAAMGDRFGPVARHEDEEEVAAAAYRVVEVAGHAPAMTILHRVDAGREWPAAMAAASARRLAVVEQSPADLLYIPTAGLDWEGYLATRSQKFRQRVARGLEKALGKAHEYEIRETSDPATLETDLATLFRLHDLRHADTSSITASRDRDFLRDFASRALARGWLRLRVLEIEGEPAAAFLGWRIGPRYAIYQSGFDPAWAHMSVGSLLLSNTVRAALEEGVDEVDMLLGGEAYKQRFAAASRAVHTLVLVPAMSPARALVSAEAAARRRTRGLAARPGIGAALRRVARRLPTGRRG